MTSNQRFVLLLVGMLLVGIALMKVSPAQTPEQPLKTIVADRFVARGAGDQQTVIDAEGIEITGQQGLITLKSFGRETAITVSPRHLGSAITMSLDGREGSIPYLTVQGDNPEQNVMITVTKNGPKITLYGGKGKKPCVINVK